MDGSGYALGRAFDFESDDLFPCRKLGTARFCISMYSYPFLVIEVVCIVLSGGIAEADILSTSASAAVLLSLKDHQLIADRLLRVLGFRLLLTR